MLQIASTFLYLSYQLSDCYFFASSTASSIFSFASFRASPASSTALSTALPDFSIVPSCSQLVTQTAKIANNKKLSNFFILELINFHLLELNILEKLWAMAMSVAATLLLRMNRSQLYKANYLYVPAGSLCSFPGR